MCIIVIEIIVNLNAPSLSNLTINFDLFPLQSIIVIVLWACNASHVQQFVTTNRFMNVERLSSKINICTITLCLDKV